MKKQWRLQQKNGSIGEKLYEANYEAINYQITYNGLEDEEKAILNNPKTYTIESQTIEIKNPEDRKDLDGDIVKKFVGWKIGVATAIDTKIETKLQGLAIFDINLVCIGRIN